MDKPQSPYIVSSVDRALELLILLGKSSRDMGVTELAKALGVQKSTTHNPAKPLDAKFSQYLLRPNQADFVPVHSKLRHLFFLFSC